MEVVAIVEWALAEGTRVTPFGSGTHVVGAIDGAAEAPVYANSGYRAERDQSLNDGDHFTHYLKQAVVLFPLVEEAGASFDASAQQWRACRQYTHTQSESQWSVGQISNANDTLSTTATQQNARAPGWGCGRALAIRNNVVIDVNTCSANPADSAVNIANQSAFLTLTSVAIIMFYLPDLAVTASMLRRRLRGEWPRPEHGPYFSLGRWGMLVNVFAVVYGTVVAFNIAWPRATVYGTKWYFRFGAYEFIGASFIVGALYYFLIQTKKSPEVLAEHRAEVPSLGEPALGDAAP